MSKRSDELILLPSLKAQRTGAGGVVLTQKYLNGVAEYAKTWPGRITSLVQIASRPTTDMDHVEVALGGSSPRIEIRPLDRTAFRERIRDAALVMPFLSPFEAWIAPLGRELGVPVVFVSEYSPRTERQIVDAEVKSRILRVRRKLWLWGAERKRRTALALATGLQCSGYPTYALYRRIQPNALLFFDNRVRVRDVIEEEALERKVAHLHGPGPLRLVFGGRLIGMKGVLELPDVARELERRHVSFTFEIFGTGPLEGELKARIRRYGLGEKVWLKGALDFDKGWIPHLKEHPDLFVCCHPQGDPSSTYPEVMSAGVPIAGYDNEAFSGIVRNDGIGWLAPTFDSRGLADVIAELARRREEIATMARRGRAFALRHAFERTFEARTRHLLAASRMPWSRTIGSREHHERDPVLSELSIRSPQSGDPSSGFQR